MTGCAAPKICGARIIPITTIVKASPATIPAMAPSLVARFQKIPRMMTGKKLAAARPKAKATTSATKPGGLIPK